MLAHLFTKAFYLQTHKILKAKHRTHTGWTFKYKTEVFHVYFTALLCVRNNSYFYITFTIKSDTTEQCQKWHNHSLKNLQSYDLLKNVKCNLIVCDCSVTMISLANLQWAKRQLSKYVIGFSQINLTILIKRNSKIKLIIGFT